MTIPERKIGRCNPGPDADPVMGVVCGVVVVVAPVDVVLVEVPVVDPPVVVVV